MNLTVDMKENLSDIQINIAGEIDVYSAPVVREKLMPWQTRGRT